MKIANIDIEILHIFWTTWEISMKFSGKMGLQTLEATKKAEFHPLFRRCIFFVKQGHEKTLVEKQIEKVKKIDRSVLLAKQDKSKSAQCLPVTHNRTLPNIKRHILTLSPVKKRPNIRGYISTNLNSSIS